MLRKRGGRLLSEIASSVLEQRLVQAFTTALLSIQADLLVAFKKSSWALP